jgi:hypothetical protein
MGISFNSYPSVNILMRQKLIVLTISVFIAALISSPLLLSNVYAQGVTGKSVILLDNVIDNARGWNPDGKTNTFTISDSDVSPLRSTVLVNTKQGNFVNCAVDYLWSGAFEVQCINIKPGQLGTGGPWNGGELHYVVFNRDTHPSFIPGLSLPGFSSLQDAPVLSGDILPIIKNRTQGVEGAAELTPEQSEMEGIAANTTGSVAANTTGFEAG